MGFKEVDPTILHHKIWTDCLKCVKFRDCDEIAVVKIGLINCGMQSAECGMF